MVLVTFRFKYKNPHDVISQGHVMGTTHFKNCNCPILAYIYLCKVFMPLYFCVNIPMESET